MGELIAVLRAGKAEQIPRIGARKLTEIKNAMDRLQPDLLLTDEIPVPDDLCRRAPDAEAAGVDPGDYSIEVLKLRPSVRASLAERGIYSLRQIANTPDKLLLQIEHVGQQTLADIRSKLRTLAIEPASPDSAPVQEAGAAEPETWASISQDYIEQENGTHVHVLLSRYGPRRRTLAQIGKELGISRERVRQLENNAADRLLARVRPSEHSSFFENMNRIMAARSMLESRIWWRLSVATIGNLLSIAGSLFIPPSPGAIYQYPKPRLLANSAMTGGKPRFQPSASWNPTMSGCAAPTAFLITSNRSKLIRVYWP